MTTNPPGWITSKTVKPGNNAEINFEIIKGDHKFMKKVTVFLLSIALTALGAMFVFGQTSDVAKEGKSFKKDGHHFGKRGKRGGKGMMFRGLDLTDAQKEQMRSIHEANRDSVKSLRDQMKANKQQLETLSAGGSFNESQVQAIAQQQGALHAQMIVNRERIKSQMFAILTPEQKSKMAEMKANREQKMQERKAKRAERKAEKETQE